MLPPETIDPTVTIWCPLTDAEAETVAELAGLGFWSDKIAEIILKNKRLFNRDYRTPGTPVYNAYRRGLYLAEAETDKPTLENSKKGNLTAKQIMEKKWEQQRIEELRQKIFNSGE